MNISNNMIKKLPIWASLSIDIASWCRCRCRCRLVEGRVYFDRRIPERATMCM